MGRLSRLSELSHTFKTFAKGSALKVRGQDAQFFLQNDEGSPSNAQVPFPICQKQLSTRRKKRILPVGFEHQTRVQTENECQTND